MAKRGRKGEKQHEILTFIHEQVSERGYPPTVREICNATGLASTSTVHGHLSRLEDQGFIIRDRSKPRAIELTEDGLDKIGINQNSGQIPLLGIVTAGEPILAVEEATDFFPIPDHIHYSSDELFMLSIRGDSMINAGILDGDLVIVKRQEIANNGDVIIAMTEDDEATCKRFFKEDTHIRLQPENDELDPIILPDIKILGKVISLYRTHVY
ncbi:MAG TPA: transcriptional repressor LexA [Candidatus Atopostipes pullistercoris]|uniref:LexA repressor n=1 Tax=Candidatus Atopostipes pullistercoris TaxID=2838467 RepID=A0A9D2G2X1_9LACT|nr:transcriptional repressor LexA [Candidatus Atopostipes pullistercoris]